MKSKRYSIKLTSPSGFVSYMQHRNKTEWCLRSAKNHIKTSVHLHGFRMELIEV